VAITKSKKPSYKTINRFRVNPKVDALLESLFIQFYSQCVKQNLIDDKAIFIDGTKLKQMPIDIHLYGKRVFKTMNQKMNEGF
jgi:transposase